MTAPDWLTARPVAHRGLHDPSLGIVENTASAFAAAVAGNYAMECDLQISADGEAMVFHDDTLDRLMDATGRVDSLSRSELQKLSMKTGADRIITLGEMCDLVAGRQPLIIELKASWSKDRRLEERVAKVLAQYKGPAAVMSFDPHSAVAFRHLAPALPRGVVAESIYSDADWADLSGLEKFALRTLMHFPVSRPHFLAWRVRDLHRAVPRLARRCGVPMLTWTVRTPSDQARARLYADQMIFEGFRA